MVTASILVTNTDAATNRTVAHSTADSLYSGVGNRRILQGTLFVLTFSSFRGDVKWLFPAKRLKKYYL